MNSSATQTKSEYDTLGFLNNSRDQSYNITGQRYAMPSTPAGTWLTREAQTAFRVMTSAICLTGIVGNIMNLMVLTRRRMRKLDGAKEGGVHYGLVNLAFSDLLVVVTLLPNTFQPDSVPLFDSKGFWMYYGMYGSAIISVFIFTSTWLTVTMATLRYFAIVHPFFLKRINVTRWANVAYCLVYFVSVGVNLPLFWQLKSVELRTNVSVHYMIDVGHMDQKEPRGVAYQIFRAIIATFAPTAILTFCNYNLVQALRESYRLHREFRIQAKQSQGNNTSSRVTLTLAIIVMAFVVLVVPSQLLDFCSIFLKGEEAMTENFLLARAVCNLLEVSNFAFNFILYCAVNAHFRAMLREMAVCLNPFWDQGYSRARRGSFSIFSPSTVTVRNFFNGGSKRKSDSSSYALDTNCHQSLVVLTVPSKQSSVSRSQSV